MIHTPILTASTAVAYGNNDLPHTTTDVFEGHHTNIISPIESHVTITSSLSRTNCTEVLILSNISQPSHHRNEWLTFDKIRVNIDMNTIEKIDGDSM